MKPYARLISIFALTTTAALAALICWLTLTPQDLPKVQSLPTDKLAHILAFAALIAPVAVLRPRFLWWILPLAALLGFGIELVQPWVGRHREWADGGADLIGLLAGTIAGLLVRRFLKRHVLPDR